METYNYKAFVERVVDGDTIDVELDLGFDVSLKKRVRFARINAYETRLGKKTTAEEKEIGLKAKEYVKNLIENKSVMLKSSKSKTGKFGRYIADVYYITDEKEVNLNDELVNLKYAVYQEY